MITPRRNEAELQKKAVDRFLATLPEKSQNATRYKMEFDNLQKLSNS